jgi:hypothetical protein
MQNKGTVRNAEGENAGRVAEEEDGEEDERQKTRVRKNRRQISLPPCKKHHSRWLSRLRHLPRKLQA